MRKKTHIRPLSVLAADLRWLLALSAHGEACPAAATLARAPPDSQTFAHLTIVLEPPYSPDRTPSPEIRFDCRWVRV